MDFHEYKMVNISKKLMSKRLGIIWNYLAHYKYLIVIVVGVLVVGVIDDNSIRQHIRYQIQIAGTAF